MQLNGCLFGRAGAEEGGAGFFGVAAAIEPAGRFGDHEGAKDKERAGRQRYPEDAAPGVVLEIEKRLGIGHARDGVDAVAKVDANECGNDEAEGEHPLEDARALAAGRGGEALGEVERDDNADKSAARALEEASEEEGRVPMRESDDRNAEDEGRAAEDHQGLAAHPVGKEAGKESGEDAAEEDGGDDDGELRRVELRGGLEVGQCAADDADIDSVEQATEAGNEKEEEVIALASAIGGGCGGIRKSAGCHECAYCISIVVKRGQNISRKQEFVLSHPRRDGTASWTGHPRSFIAS